MRISDITPQNRAYKPCGILEDAFYCQEDFIASGSAGSGKTAMNLERLLYFCTRYKGIRCLIVRKTRASLTESVLVTWEERVLPEGHPCIGKQSRMHRHSYRFPNGSEIVCGGMDTPTRVLSTEYDIIYVPEAIELAENDWDTLSTRLRNGKLPWQQMTGDTNPGSPSHWIKVKEQRGQLKLFYSSHEDNPRYYDRQTKTWTEEGAKYIARLDKLPHLQRERMRWGKWIQAEGVVYAEWNPAVHLINPFPIPDSWDRIWSIDFGYNHPCVVLWVAIDPDGVCYVYREFHRTGMRVEEVAREVMAASHGEPLPSAIVCDHDAENRATFEHYTGLTTVAAKKDVQRGIEIVAGCLRKRGDGKCGLYVFHDSLISRDPHLEEAKQPLKLADEMDAYVYNPNKPDEPVKQFDDSCDSMRYAMAHLFWYYYNVGTIDALNQPEKKSVEDRLRDLSEDWKPEVFGLASGRPKIKPIFGQSFK